MAYNTPPMGWNSWNTFGDEFNEKTIKEIADAMVSSGLKDAGYEYVLIDDAWQTMDRDAEGRLQAHPEKFPSGMKALSDYIHSLGLKFGIYSCSGPLTCCSRPGSLDHEFIDAKTFAEWGVDYLKYDYCYHSPVMHGKYLYRRMGLALKNSGREILFSACTIGRDEPGTWMRETPATMWRSTCDISDSWESIKDLTKQQDAILELGGKACYNDMDMLVVGMRGKGNVALGGCTDTEYKTHFSIWAMFGSPLIIGSDIRNMDEATKAILTNKELIKINKDEAYRQVIKLTAIDEDVPCYARMLDNGDIAIGCFSFADSDGLARFTIDELGLTESTGKTLELHSLWDDECLTITHGTFMHTIKAHDCLVYRARVVDIK